MSAVVNRRVWVKIEPWDTQIATTALEGGADAIVVADEHTAAVRSLGVIDVVSASGEIKPGDDVVEIEITGQHDEPRIVEAARDKLVIVRPRDWTIIPLENLIAQTRNVLMEARSLEETKTYLGVLEKGVDGVVIHADDAGQVKAMLEAVKGGKGHVDLTEAKVTAVRQLAMGDRVCVDCCSMMALGEGMLIGSSSAAMFLVHAETSENPYVAPRPFRVNAGPVHAYIRIPGDRTRYLSELRTGDEVLVANYTGDVRPAVVGRIKREVRPLLLVEAECEGKSYSVILQNAETVRLTDPQGKPVSVVNLRAGDAVLVAIEAAGRHFGHRIEETIAEV